jgi:hypothetical protein
LFCPGQLQVWTSGFLNYQKQNPLGIFPLQVIICMLFRCFLLASLTVLANLHRKNVG